MKEALLAGEPCDVMILSDALIHTLVVAGRLRGDARVALGRVRTGIAVPTGRPHPDVASPDALRRALQAADAVYFPDPQRATAGIHFARVLASLGIAESLQERLITHPNGATAMAAMARSGLPGAIGCTQVTEILHTPGVELVAVLPAQFELATVYTAALSAQAADAALATRWLQTLAAAEHRALRESLGFET
jgi:molybdate transport system substrate-binding protein